MVPPLLLRGDIDVRMGADDGLVCFFIQMRYISPPPNTHTNTLTSVLLSCAIWELLEYSKSWAAIFILQTIGTKPCIPNTFFTS